VIEHFLNGDNLKFQACLSTICRNLKYDPFFGDFTQDFGESKLIFRRIRQKALLQFVQPYKVIELKEIAKEFDCTVADIEGDLETLIQEGKIDFKLDLLRGSLNSIVKNKKTEAMEKVKTQGEVFLANTEALLIRTKALTTIYY